MNENKANYIFDLYINGNISYFKTEIRKLTKLNLLKCIDILISQYGFTFGNDQKDIFRIFLYHMQF
jgi:hypothetical protein